MNEGNQSNKKAFVRGQKRKREDADQRVDWRRPSSGPANGNNGENKSGETRRPKKKVALLLGYCGTGYHGMQINPPHKTIEGELFNALVEAGAISRDNADDPKKSSFLRAARTDKGVHAAGNVISAKLIVEDEDIIERINAKLPESIRVWGYFRTNKKFECRRSCGSRIYEYLIPTFSFLPPRPSSILGEKLKTGSSTSEDAEGLEFWESVTAELEKNGVSTADLKKADDEIQALRESKSSDSSELRESDQVKLIKSIENSHRRAYRISSQRLEKVRAAFKVYEGVHNFHNFTLGKDFNDASATRVMRSLTVSDPMIVGNTEWVSIKIHGQSFMLHQIRKMVAMACLVVRTRCPLSRISEAFQRTKINIPKAPSLGLLLEAPQYDGINKKLESLGHDGITFEPWQEKLDAFKDKYIYSKIYSEEAKENVFHGFFSFIDSYNGDNFDYLTAKGISKKPLEKLPIDEEDEDSLEGDIEG